MPLRQDKNGAKAAPSKAQRAFKKLGSSLTSFERCIRRKLRAPKKLLQGKNTRTSDSSRSGCLVAAKGGESTQQQQQQQQKQVDDSPRVNTTAKETRQQTQSNKKSSGKPRRGPSNEFHFFRFLPTEVRLQIWREATQYKRRVVLHAPYHSAHGWARWLLCTRVCGVDRWPGPLAAAAPRLGLGWTSSTPNPAMLSVNYEARTVALGAWEPAFGFAHLPGRVWINFDRDDVVFVKGEIPRVDYRGGQHVRGWSRLPVLRDYRDRAGQQVKPVSVLGEVWQDTPDLERIQRTVMLNAGHHIDSRIDFSRRPGVFRNLKSAMSISVERPPKRGWVEEATRTLRGVFRPPREEAILAQGGHGYVMGRRDGSGPTEFSVVWTAFTHEAYKEETYQLPVTGQDLMITHASMANSQLYFIFLTPARSYCTVNGRVY